LNTYCTASLTKSWSPSRSPEKERAQVSLHCKAALHTLFETLFE